MINSKSKWQGKIDKLLSFVNILKYFWPIVNGGNVGRIRFPTIFPDF